MEADRPGEAGARVLSQQVSTLLALLTGGNRGLTHVEQRSFYYTHAKEGFFMLLPLQVSWFLGWPCGNPEVWILSMS